MIKELMHDPIFLAGKSEVATKEDLQVAQDLFDTLKAFSMSIGRAIARNPDLLLVISKELNNPKWGDLANELQNQIERDHLLKNINDYADLYDGDSIEETYRTWGTHEMF